MWFATPVSKRRRRSKPNRTDGINMETANLSRTREGGISEATRGSAVHAVCFAATSENNTAKVRILPAQHFRHDAREDNLGVEQ